MRGLCWKSGHRLPQQPPKATPGHPSCLLWSAEPGSALGPAYGSCHGRPAVRGDSVLALVSFPHVGRGADCPHVKVGRVAVLPSDGGPGGAALTPELPWPLVALSPHQLPLADRSFVLNKTIAHHLARDQPPYETGRQPQKAIAMQLCHIEGTSVEIPASWGSFSVRG